MSQKGTSESQLSSAYVEQSQRITKLDSTPQSRTRSNSRRQEYMRRRTAFDRAIKYSDPATTGQFMALRGSNSRRRRTRTGNEGPCRKRGFSTRLNPSAWVRAVHKFNSVIVTTRFRSMHIPVSIRTRNTMADIKALVDSGATDCFMSEKFI